MHRLAGFFLTFLLLCGSTWSPASAQDKSLTVFAAASMKNALDEADTAYTAKTGVKVAASYAASSTLAKQIEQGAPADIFASADTDWMDYAIGKKNINESTRVNLLGNSIVLIAPKDSKIDSVAIGKGFDLAKLAGDGKIATGDVKAVPVGKYAKAALEKLGAWQAAEPKFAMRRRSASSIPPTPGSNPESRSSAPSPPIPTPRSSIPSRRPRPPSRMRPGISRSCAARQPGPSSRNTASSSSSPRRPDACSTSRRRSGRRFCCRCALPRSRPWWRRRSASASPGCWRDATSGASR
jgi:ABC-type molybdate transport system substrate-binding protein